MKIAITIPAYNEEKTIGKVIENIKKVMEPLGHKCEILVVDDGSADNTAKVAKKAGAKVFSHPYNYGLAEAFRTEIRHVIEGNYEAVVHIDADGQYRAGDIHKLLEPIEKNEADLVLGSRFTGKIEGMSSIKRLGNKAFSRIISHLIRTKVTDCQTGFRAFTRDFAEKVDIKSTHTYTQEMIIKGVRGGFRLREVPVYFDKRREGKSKLITNPFGYAVRAWLNILRIYRDYEPLKFFGSIGVVLMLSGLIIGVYFLYLHFFAGGIVGHMGLLFLLIMFMFSGLQIILFGFLADKNR